MLRIYDDWKQARQTVLCRRDMMVLDEVPESMRASIQRVFGEPLTPEEAVTRILADVRERGDTAGPKRAAALAKSGDVESI